MRISDWSSDVCSSDLPCAGLRRAVTDLAVDPFAFSGGHGPAFAIAASELAGTVDRGRRGGGRAGRCLLVELAPVPFGSLSDLARGAAPVARNHPGGKGNLPADHTSGDPAAARDPSRDCHRHPPSSG